MPTALERATDRSNRKLANHGLNPDGAPIDPANIGNDDEGNEDDEGQGAPLNRARQAPAGDEALRSEINDLRTQLTALNGRVAPSQRDAETYRSLYSAEQTARQTENQNLTNQINALRDQLETRNTSVAVEELLTEDERAAMDPGTLTVITKIADAIAKRHAPKIDARAEAMKVLDERDAQRVTNHRNQVMSDPTRELHKLGQLAYDPEFIKWSQEEDNDVDSVVSSLFAARSTEEIDRYSKIVCKRIAAFRARTKETPPTDPRPSLSSHMRRSEGPKLTSAQRLAREQEAKNLSRSRNPADRARALKILEEL